MNIPIIRFEIEGMRHSIHVALTEYAMRMDADIKAAVDAACTPERIAEIIKHTAEDAIDYAIKNEIDSFFRHGAGRAAVRDAVQKMLAKEEG